MGGGYLVIARNNQESRHVEHARVSDSKTKLKATACTTTRNQTFRRPARHQRLYQPLQKKRKHWPRSASAMERTEPRLAMDITHPH